VVFKEYNDKFFPRHKRKLRKTASLAQKLIRDREEHRVSWISHGDLCSCSIPIHRDCCRLCVGQRLITRSIGNTRKRIDRRGAFSWLLAGEEHEPRAPDWSDYCRMSGTSGSESANRSAGPMTGRLVRQG